MQRMVEKAFDATRGGVRGWMPVCWSSMQTHFNEVHVMHNCKVIVIMIMCWSSMQTQFHEVHIVNNYDMIFSSNHYAGELGGCHFVRTLHLRQDGSRRLIGELQSMCSTMSSLSLGMFLVGLLLLLLLAINLKLSFINHHGPLQSTSLQGDPITLEQSPHYCWA